MILKLLKTVTLAACVVISVFSALPASAAAPTHVDIEETEARWQTFPEEVCRVLVQNGKRAWYEVAHPARREELPVVKKIIKEQFSQAGPQVFGVTPVLFEPGGRVWFKTHSCRTILSYDGKSFGEYPSKGETHYYVGSCSNTGIAQSLNYRHGCDTTVGGTVFLAESHGVLCVTGTTPSYHELTPVVPMKRGNLNYPVIVTEADGKGLLAYVEVSGKVILHRWRNGDWTEIDVPRKLTRGIGGIVPWPHGAWVFQGGEPMFFVRYEKLGDSALRGLLARLGDRKYSVREEATKRLMGMGHDVRDALNAARQATSDPEVRMRLDRVLTATKVEQGVSSIVALRLEQARLGLYEGGWMYITSSKIVEDGVDCGAGVAVVKPDSTYKLFLGNSIMRAFSHYSKPLVVKEHALIWTGAPDGAKLFDVAKGEFVVAATESSFPWLHAVKSDGTVYLGRGESPHPRPVAVFRSVPSQIQGGL